MACGRRSSWYVIFIILSSDSSDDNGCVPWRLAAGAMWAEPGDA